MENIPHNLIILTAFGIITTLKGVDAHWEIRSVNTMLKHPDNHNFQDFSGKRLKSFIL